MPRTTQDSIPPGDRHDLLRLFRSGHIFSSAVRDTLEHGILREVSQVALTLPQFLLLKLMSLNGELRAHEVADFLGVSRPAATKNIDKMVRAGLITRRQSRGDRRVTLLAISPMGRRLVHRFEQARRRRIEPLLQRFTAAEIRRLTELMDRASVALLRQRRCGQQACLRCCANIENDCPIGPIQGGCPYEHVGNAAPDDFLTGGMA